MHLLNITLLLAILIFAILNYNHQVLSKKSDLSKTHANRNKHQIQHHKQPQLHHKKSHANKKHSKHNKHPMQHDKQNKKSHENTNSPIHKQHFLQHNKKHLKSKQQYGHHELKVSHNHKPHINHFLRASEKFCPLVQNERIIHGEVANGNVIFPYTAIYYICDRPRTKPVSYNGCNQWCGGSIISHFHILTAAHCMFDHNNHLLRPHEIVVRVGVRDLKDPEENSDHYRTTLEVQNIVIHKDYSDPMMTLDDIAIIKLKDAIQFSDLIRPVCINGLHFNFYFQGQYPDVIVAGWGATDEDGNLSDVLKFTHQFILSFLSCDVKFKEKSAAFCVYGYFDRPGYTCNGDSGSGLLPTDKLNPVNVLVGVLHGRLKSDLCDDIKIYLNVSTYANWINENAI